MEILEVTAFVWVVLTAAAAFLAATTATCEWLAGRDPQLGFCCRFVATVPAICISGAVQWICALIAKLAGAAENHLGDFRIWLESFTPETEVYARRNNAGKEERNG